MDDGFGFSSLQVMIIIIIVSEEDYREMGDPHKHARHTSELCRRTYIRSTCEKSGAAAGALAGGRVLELGVSGLGVRDCCLIRGGGERVEVARTKRLVESARVVSTEERLGGSLDLVRLTGRSDELV